MDSGYRTVTTNTRERAVSDDLNRMQAFAGAGLSELLRYMLDVSYGTDDLDAGAIASEFASQGNPLRAEVIGGLLVRPLIGSISITVDAGLLLCIDPSPTANTDDSPYKYVSDSGVGITAGLAFANNVGGGDIRIDVVECQRQVVVVESDNRDVFNPNTGTFTATTVSKATKSILNYRIRKGTAGAGFPGTAQGWLPLMVASIPDGATSCDAMTFWDVRPMLEDRAFSQNVSLASARRLLSRIDAVNNLGSATGVVDWVLGSRRLGGRLRRGSPGTDGDTVDLNAAANWSPNMAGSPAGTLAYLYLATAFGLPRWARYTDASSGARKPRSPRGILVMSPATPDESGQGQPLLPASLGFGTGPMQGVATACTIYDGAEMISFGDSGTAQAIAVEDSPNVPGAITPPNVADVTLTAGVHFPPHARELQIAVDWDTPTASPVYLSFSLAAMAHGFEAFQHAETLTYAAAGGTPGIGTTIWLPIPATYPGNPSTLDLKFTVTSDLADTINSMSVNVIGWRL